MKLTDIGIRALKPSATGAQIHYDDTLTGFGVRVAKGGTKSFVLTHGTRRQRQTIGRVGIISLTAARTAAKKLLAEYTLGKQEPRTKTWEVALDEFLAVVRQKNRPSTLKSYKRHLEAHFRFKGKKLGTLSPYDFQDALDQLKDRPAELHHAFVYVRVFVNWCYRRHYLEKNPLDRMDTPPASKSKERILTDQEIKKVWNAAPDDPFGRRVKLLLLCGQRPTETGQLATCKRDGDLLTLPGAITKNKRDHTFPFPPMAGPYLHDLAYGGFSKAKARLDKASGVSDWTLHDCRRTLRSGWASLGISKEVAERYINHVSGTHSGVSAIYDRYTYLPEMRAAVAHWQAHLHTVLEL